MSNTTVYNQVYFLCAARMAGQAIIVASYAYNIETDLGAVKQVLEQPNMKMAPGKHYSFSFNDLAWHLIAGRNLEVMFFSSESYSGNYNRRYGSDIRVNL